MAVILGSRKELTAFDKFRCSLRSLNVERSSFKLGAITISRHWRAVLTLIDKSEKCRRSCLAFGLLLKALGYTLERIFGLARTKQLRQNKQGWQHVYIIEVTTSARRMYMCYAVAHGPVTIFE